MAWNYAFGFKTKTEAETDDSSRKMSGPRKLPPVSGTTTLLLLVIALAVGTAIGVLAPFLPGIHRWRLPILDLEFAPKVVNLMIEHRPKIPSVDKAARGVLTARMGLCEIARMKLWQTPQCPMFKDASLYASGIRRW